MRTFTTTAVPLLTVVVVLPAELEAVVGREFDARPETLEHSVGEILRLHLVRVLEPHQGHGRSVQVFVRGPLQHLIKGFGY